MITLEGPQGKSFKKAGKGQSLPPFLAMPGFWVHMVPQLIPKFETFSEIKVCHQSLDSKGILAQCFSEIIMVNRNIIKTFFFFQSHLSGSKPLIDEALVHLFLNLLSQALQIRN